LVARGFIQEFGIDFHDTFTPTLKHDSIRILTSIAAQNNFNIEQININAAYLNTKLSEYIYMKPPEGHQDFNRKFWKINKAIYGLKQSGREWKKEINKFLIKIEFRRMVSEPCIYVKNDKNKNVLCIVDIYVDNILIAGKEN